MANEVNLSVEEEGCFCREWEYWTKYLLSDKRDREKMVHKPLRCQEGRPCKSKKNCVFWL